MIASYCISCECACGVTGLYLRTVFVLLAGLEWECLVSDASVYYSHKVTFIEQIIECVCSAEWPNTRTLFVCC